MLLRRPLEVCARPFQRRIRDGVYYGVIALGQGLFGDKSPELARLSLFDRATAPCLTLPMRTALASSLAPVYLVKDPQGWAEQGGPEVLML